MVGVRSLDLSGALSKLASEAAHDPHILKNSAWHSLDPSVEDPPQKWLIGSLAKTIWK